MAAQEWGRASDTELLDLCRQGEIEAFGVLWDRHRSAALVAARGIAPTLDSDDLVAEAYLRILELTTKNKGPRGAFRPYLYRVIQSVAVDSLRSPERPSNELDQIPNLHETGPWEDNAFDLNAVAVAFSTLDERWQAALWYSEVEGLPPRRVATLLGISANSVSALTRRAREGLKSAWVEAHVSDQLSEAACHATRRDLQRYQRGKLTSRASREVEAHLDGCETCAAVATEFSTLNRQLGLLLGTVFLGSAGAAALLGKLGSELTSHGAAAATAVPKRGSHTTGNLGTSAGSSAATAAGAGIGTTIAVTSGAVAAAVALLGGAVLVVSSLVAPAEGDAPAPVSTEQVDEAAVQETEPDSADHSEPEEAKEELSPDESAGLFEPSNDGSEMYAPVQPIIPVKPTPTPPPPVTPPPPTDGSDASILSGFGCYVSGAGMLGTANEYGVIRLRAILNTGTAIEIIPSMYDPAHVGQPGNLFTDVGGQPLFDDGRGNTFAFGFFTGTNPGTDPTDPLGWFGADPESIPEWSAHLPGLTLDDVTVELRLVTPDGRFSPWTPIDTSITTCPS